MKKRLTTIIAGFSFGIGLTISSMAFSWGNTCCDRYCSTFPPFFQQECLRTCVNTPWGGCYLQ